jgi:predicted ATPase
VRIYGIRGTAALLGNACCLLWPGRRSRPPRHRTLYASLDWSYNLLSVSERLTLHRLSRIDGPFCLEAAAGDQVASAPLAEDLARLAEKSLVCVDVAATPPQYRLLEATRVYVAQKIAQSGEAARLERQQVVTATTRDVG